MLLEEEESPTTGEDEEGAISDNSLDIMEETSEKVKVSAAPGVLFICSCFAVSENFHD